MISQRKQRRRNEGHFARDVPKQARLRGDSKSVFADDDDEMRFD